MEALGPSILYGLQSIISILPADAIRQEEFVREDSPLLFGNQLSEILVVLERCQLIFRDAKSIIHVTPRGKELSILSAPFIARELILLLVHAYRPTWAKLILRGRNECLPSLPSRVCQCLEEAGLAAQPLENDVIDWWRRASILSRSFGDKIGADVGIMGETLSFNLERDRTNTEPQLISIESTRAGFDILSVVELGSKENLRIEVKASTHRKNDAFFFVTENEWRIARSRGNHLFHLWLLLPSTFPRLARVTTDKIEPHISDNRGKGRWTSVKIPFKHFEFEEIRISA